MPFPPEITNPRNLSERFSQLIGRLQRALFTAYDTQLRRPEPLPLLAWNRLSGLKRRFAALAERLRTGTLRAPPPPRQLPAAPRPAASLPPAPRPAAPRPANPLPRQPGWLLGMAWEPWHLNACRPQFQALLADPELAAMATAAPQVGRLVRPLCRMLAITPPPGFALRPRRPRPKPEAKPKPPKFVDINRMSAVAWGNFVHPEHPGMNHPPNRIGYGGSWWPPKKPR